MRPMYETALRVPNVFSVKSDRITLTQVVYPRGEFDIVLDEHCVTRGETDDESLMRRTRIVIRQYP